MNAIIAEGLQRSSKSFVNHIFGFTNTYWIDQQINDILVDPGSCSFEVCYRSWYNFVLHLRTSAVFRRDYGSLLAAIVDVYVPMVIYSKCLSQHKSTTQLCITQKCIDSVSMYVDRDLLSDPAYQSNHRKEHRKVYRDIDIITKYYITVYIIFRKQLDDDIALLICEAMSSRHNLYDTMQNND